MDIDVLVGFNPWWTEKRVPNIFLGKFGIKKGVIISKDTTAREEGLVVIPLWQFLFKEKIEI